MPKQYHYSDSERALLNEFLDKIIADLAREADAAISFGVPGLESYYAGKMKSVDQRVKHVEYIREMYVNVTKGSMRNRIRRQERKGV